jgi:2-polyprenyl-6-methoxyphenol hydroxylase-like FAD-dependent oxidoreductase
MAATLVKDAVLVVGAGQVGLVAACQLAKQGVRPRVIDALEQPNTESRAVAVHARSLEMLAALGVLPQLEARARRVVAVRMAEGTSGRQLAQVDLADLPSRHPYTLDVPQPDTEDALRERAAELGVTVERGVALTALARDPGGVDVTLGTPRGAESCRVGWVVGADGAHGVTRRLLGTRLEGDPPDPEAGSRELVRAVDALRRPDPRRRRGVPRRGSHG